MMRRGGIDGQRAAGGQPGKSKASVSPAAGGGRAGLASGTVVGSPTWARIRWTTGGSSIVAMKRRRPPQAAHARISKAKTRRIKSAQAQYRRRGATRSAAGGSAVSTGGLGAPRDAAGAVAAAVAGAAMTGAVLTGTAGTGAAAACAADGTGSRGTTCATMCGRARACDANTPCYAERSIMRSQRSPRPCPAGWRGVDSA